jgi:large subunit ribosomal protein L17
MRHGKKINHLSRKSAHRKAMLSNMATSLIIHKRITTTLAKAKALRVYVEPLISRSKDDTTHSRRVVFSHLQSKEAVTTLFRDVSSKVADRPGGYTRIIKLGLRLGDNAEMAMIELVDFNVNLLGDKAGVKAKTTRRAGKRGSAKKAGEEAHVATAEVKKPKAATAEKPVAPVVTESVAEELPPEEVADVVEETEPVAEAEEPADEPAEEPASEAEPEEEPKA